MGDRIGVTMTLGACALAFAVLLSLPLGILGAAMTAAHGFWDYMRVPILTTQWDSAIAARQEAISTFAGQPNPVDPRGLGAFLLLGLFALVAARPLADPQITPAGHPLARRETADCFRPN